MIIFAKANLEPVKIFARFGQNFLYASYRNTARKYARKAAGHHFFTYPDSHMRRDIAQDRLVITDSWP